VTAGHETQRGQITGAMELVSTPGRRTIQEVTEFSAFADSRGQDDLVRDGQRNGGGLRPRDHEANRPK